MTHHGTTQEERDRAEIDATVQRCVDRHSIPLVTDEEVEEACEAYSIEDGCEAPFSEWEESEFKAAIRKLLRAALEAAARVRAGKEKNHG